MNGIEFKQYCLDPVFTYFYLELPPDRHELDPGEGQGAVQQQLAGGDGGL